MSLHSSIFRSMEFLSYNFRARGLHQIHSPFLFELYQNVILQNSAYYSYSKIENLRIQLLASKEMIEIEDFGTGAMTNREKKISVASIANHHIKSSKYGQVLFRLINYFKSENILELGTSLGITTLYLATPNPKSKVVTLEGSNNTSKIAEENFRILQVNNIEIKKGEFSITLPNAINEFTQLDFVFFDGNHLKKPTFDYFNQCLSKHHEKSIFVFDDIYHSPEMKSAWNEIKNHPSVTLSLDLFSLGIIFFRKELRKQTIILRY